MNNAYVELRKQTKRNIRVKVREVRVENTFYECTLNSS